MISVPGACRDRRTDTREAPYAMLYTGVRTNVCAPRVGGFYQHPVYDIDPSGFWIE